VCLAWASSEEKDEGIVTQPSAAAKASRASLLFI
jgi:hypothetical protein